MSRRARGPGRSGCDRVCDLVGDLVGEAAEMVGP